MKKLLSLLLFVTGLFLISSCNKSDEKLLFGTWETKTIVNSRYQQGSDSMQSQNTQTFNPGDLTLEFRNDNTCITYGAGSFLSNVTYSIDGNNMMLNGKACTFTVSKTMLTISYSSDGEFLGMKIHEESTMTLERE